MNRRLNYYKYLVIKNSLFFLKYIDVIKKESQINCIDPELLFAIIIVEFVNRGNLLNRYFERICSFIIPNILVKKDISLGICQIRISTAKKFKDKTTDLEIIKILLDDKLNIGLCAGIIGYYVNCHQHLSLSNLVKFYTTGDPYYYSFPWIIFYTELVNWSINNEIFSRLVDFN